MTGVTPYKKGYLPVSDGHELYYEACGNPQGKPILFLHGGPGGGFDDDDKRFFNMDKWHVIFFDQRGSGKSKPFASLHENTTQKLLQDIIAMLDFFQIKKVCLFGGSWGSTLALAFAVTHPEKVTGLMLRGIFLGTTSEIEYWTEGGVADFFPDVWNRFVSVVPENKRDNILAYYDTYMREGDKQTKHTLTYEWARYEMSLLHLQTNEKRIDEDLQKLSFESLSPIEIHYMLNNCFLSKNYILDNLKKLANKPTTIVQGRYDVICPPKSAYILHKALPHSSLYFVVAGHSSSESEITKKLIEETENMWEKV